MKTSTRTLVCLLSSVAVLAAGKVHAAALASDTASNTAYDDGWQAGDNGGTGFGVWSFSTSGNGGSYLGATGLGDPTFGLFAGGSGGSDLSSATRAFSGDLLAGQTFSIDLGHSTNIANGGEVGILLTDGGSTVMTLKFVGGQTNWLLNDGGADFSSGQGYAANTALTFDFTFEGGNSYSYSFGSGSGSNFTANNTISGIDGFTIFSNNQGSGENFGADNMTVVPEASSLVLFGVFGASMGVVGFLRRKRR